MLRAAFTSIRFQRIARVFGLCLIGALLSAASGCALLESCGCKSPPPGPPVNEVTTYWSDEIRYAPDTEHQGRPMPGLAGRVWLISEDIQQMVEADGSIYAEMFDATKGAEGRKLADWTFDRENLKLLKRSDMIGMGYTLFLPWETYNPQIKQVQLRVAYMEKNRMPHYAQPQIISLKTSDQMPSILQMEYTEVPGQRRALPKPK